MSRYIKFTEEDTYIAAHKDIKEFLESRGEKIIHSGTEYMWERHDSVKIRAHVWYRHSTGEGGNAIDFLREFYNMSYQDAVITLLDGKYGNTSDINISMPTRKKEKKFYLYEKHENNNRVFGYLCSFRCIDYKIAAFFVKKDYIYESKDKHNCVFVGFDKYKKPRYAALKGTNSNIPFTGEISNSDKAYAFNYLGGSDTLYVFEAAIDLFSFLTLYRANVKWYEDNYVALGSLSRLALERILNEQKNIKKIYLCLDNDSTAKENHGQLAAKKFKDELTERGYNVEIIVPINKDWNEDLKLRGRKF